MNADSFNKLVNLIKDHSIFQAHHNEDNRGRQQAPSHHQLAVFYVILALREVVAQILLYVISFHLDMEPLPSTLIKLLLQSIPSEIMSSTGLTKKKG